jgi:MarR family transcriptional regulator for hemolysin
MEWPMPRTGEINVDFLFALFEVQRMLRLYADKQARRYGLTRAQWAVLAKLERTEGLKQTEIADLMEMQPITLTRLIDKLCEAGLIERRSDDTDRRVNRLYLTKAARPLMAKLAVLRGEITQAALAGLSNADTHRLVDDLESIKDNVREALASTGQSPKITKFKEPRYG